MSKESETMLSILCPSYSQHVCIQIRPSDEYRRPSTLQVTTGLGLLLVVFGIGSKMGAIYGTGYNTYYW